MASTNDDWNKQAIIGLATLFVTIVIAVIGWIWKLHRDRGSSPMPIVATQLTVDSQGLSAVPRAFSRCRGGRRKRFVGPREPTSKSGGRLFTKDWGYRRDTCQRADKPRAMPGITNSQLSSSKEKRREEASQDRRRAADQTDMRYTEELDD